MARPVFEAELSLFAKDLFADLMSRHPLFCLLRSERGGSPYFTSEIGKCVMLRWYEIRSQLQPKLRSDFPRFAKTEDSFRRYLKYFVDLFADESIPIERKRFPTSQLFILPAILLEIIGFLYRRGVPHFLRNASEYLLFMLSSVKSNDFYGQGGWDCLASQAVELTRDYDEGEILRPYLSENVCSFGTPLPPVKIRSPSEPFSETSRGISKKTPQEVHAARTEDVKISAEKSVSTLENRESTEVKALSPDQSEKDLRKNYGDILFHGSSISGMKNATVECAKGSDNLEADKISQLPQTEVDPTVSVSAPAAGRGAPIEDCSFQTPLELETSLTTSEAVKDVTESSVGKKMLDSSEPSDHDIGKSTAEYEDSAKDSKESGDRQAEIQHLSSESSIKITFPSEGFSETSSEISEKDSQEVVAIVHEAGTEGIKNQTEKGVSTLDNQESMASKDSGDEKTSSSDERTSSSDEDRSPSSGGEDNPPGGGGQGGSASGGGQGKPPGPDDQGESPGPDDQGESPGRDEKNPSKETPVIVPIELSTLDIKNITVICAKGSEYIEGNKISQLPQTEVDHIVSESALTSEKESPIDASSSQTPSQHVTENVSNLETPKHEANKKHTLPKKSRTPLSHEGENSDVKAEEVKKVTPSEGNPKCPPLVSKEKKCVNTQKRLKSKTSQINPKSPRIPSSKSSTNLSSPKASANLEAPNTPPKSSDEVSRSTKNSGISKPRLESASVTKSVTKSPSKVALKDPHSKFKTNVLPNVSKPSTSKTSKPVTKNQASAKNVHAGSKSARNVQSPKANTGNAKKSTVAEKSVESHTDESASASGNGACKDDFDIKDSSSGRREETKDAKKRLSGSSAKNISSASTSGRKRDPKNPKDEKPKGEKPRWT